jgi:hypothetical protein
MRSARDILGHDGGVHGAPGVVGVRATPAFVPAPNSVPVGALTGVPPRTQFYSRPVIPASMLSTADQGNSPTLIVASLAANRVAILTAPLVGFTIFIGDAGVTPQSGLALPPGLTYETILPGLQDLYAVTNAPVYLQLQIQVAGVLMAERQREVG